LLSINPAAVFIAVRADSGIKSIDDLRNKRIGFYPKGSLGNTIVEQLFEVSGFTIEDIKKNGGSVSYLGFAEGPGQLADNQIDCYTVLGSWPVTVLMEVDFNPGIRVIPIDDALFAKLNAKYPLYTHFSIPANTFKSFGEPFKTVGSMVCMIANEKMSDDMAYIATKAFWDNYPDIRERAVDSRNADISTALSGIGIPIHPGAVKYYKEKGITIPSVK
jgi:TRAP transporter TAXI family solute receptor